MLRRLALLLLTCTTYLGYDQTVAGALEGVAKAKQAMSGSRASVAIDQPLVSERAIELMTASRVDEPLPTHTPIETSTPKPAAQPPWQWWAALIALGILSGAGAIRYCISRFKPNPLAQTKLSFNSLPKAKQTVEATQAVQATQAVETRIESVPSSAHVENDNGYLALPEIPSEPSGNIESLDSSTLFMQETTRLPKINIREELIRDLHSLDPVQRRKAIWDLGQQGDSQAIQPLVDLMMDSDSNQRSLILAAISEIGVRTLKPMNRALIISLQDESPDVRKNAIRDLTRIYDQIAQMSQLLGHAVNDADPEVQETAHWALNQLNRIRTIAGTDNNTLLTTSTSAPEYLSGDSSSPP